MSKVVTVTLSIAHEDGSSTFVRVPLDDGEFGERLDVLHTTLDLLQEEEILAERAFIDRHRVITAGSKGRRWKSLGDNNSWERDQDDEF